MKFFQKTTHGHALARLFFVTSFVVTTFSVLLWRLIDVQLLRGQGFWESAERNRWFELPVLPNRGVILDRFGLPIVQNERFYTLVDQPDQLYSKSKIISQEEALPLLATTSSAVRVNSRRKYPYGPALAPVTGYIGAITQEELKLDKLIQPFQVLGKSGLELTYEKTLRGLLGVERFEVDALVKRQRQFLVKPAQNGTDLRTSIDPYLSEVAYRALNNQRGVVVISDTNTGQVLALVSKPTYDPNVFTQLNPLHDLKTRQVASEKIQEWFGDEHQPFFNRAVNGQYPPGSVFKLVTALAGLETKVIDLETTVLDEGVLKVGDFSYANWLWTQHGRTEGDIGLIRSISRSNDIFFYKTAEWVGPDQLAEWSKVLGLGNPVGIEIGPEASGLVPDPAWKQATVGEPWYLGNTYHYGIGQGDVKTTPLQLLQLGQVFGHDGTLCSPRIVESNNNSCHEVGVSREAVDAVLHGMLDACAPNGTSFPFFDRNATALANLSLEFGYELQGSFVRFDPDLALQRGAVACKTGTAEFGGQDIRGFRKTHGLWLGVLEPELELLEQNVESLTKAQSEADDQAGANDQSLDNVQFLTNQELRQHWIEAVKSITKKGNKYPTRIAVTVIVESDDDNPYKEGSKDAAPVALQIVNWLEGKALDSESEADM
jgi:penicillin-binding protein 2